MLPLLAPTTQLLHLRHRKLHPGQTALLRQGVCSVLPMAAARAFHDGARPRSAPDRAVDNIAGRHAEPSASRRLRPFERCDALRSRPQRRWLAWMGSHCLGLRSHLEKCSIARLRVPFGRTRIAMRSRSWPRLLMRVAAADLSVDSAPDHASDPLSLHAMHLRTYLGRVM